MIQLLSFMSAFDIFACLTPTGGLKKNSTPRYIKETALCIKPPRTTLT